MTRPATVARARPAARDPHRTLALTVGALGSAMAAASLLGPVGWGVMVYRTSPTTLNQLLGSDAATLFLVAPLALTAAVACGRRHPAGAPLASGVGVFAAYTYAQVVVGQEYLRRPGNVERFFPLLLAGFVLGWVTVVLALRAIPDDRPAAPRRLERVTGVVLLLLAVFLVFGQHLRPMVVAWTDPTELTEYASSPTPFWLVKLMDLGIVAPVAVAAGLGLLRHAAWARRLTYPLLTGYACLAASVTTMAVVMQLKSDPDASLPVTAGFLSFAVAMSVLTASLYRPLLSHRHEGRPCREEETAPGKPPPVPRAADVDREREPCSPQPEGR